MTCHLVGAKSLSETVLEYCQLDYKEQTSVIFNRNSDIFFHDNALEGVVCEMAFILSRPQCVKTKTVEVNFFKNIWLSLNTSGIASILY